MKKLRMPKLIAVLSILLILMSLFSVKCFAENEEDVVTTELNEETTNQVVETQDKKDGDLFLCKNNVTIDYNVSGNVYILGENVTINSKIDGNVFVLANKLELGEKTYIYSDLFVCANDVTVKGYVYDIYSMSNNLTLASTSYIIRDITATANTINLNGLIKRNANLSFENVKVSETTAKIGGNLNYSAKTEAIPQSIVVGSTAFSQAQSESISVTRIIADYISDFIRLLILSLIVIVIALLAKFKVADENTLKVVKNKPWQTLGVGALILLLTPMACFILFCTVIGIIPAAALLLIYIFLIQISPAIVSIPVGKMLCDKIKKDSKGMRILMSALTVAVIFILKLIPIIGGIAGILVAMFALGIIFYSTFNPEKKASSQEQIVIEEKKQDDK